MKINLILLFLLIVIYSCKDKSNVNDIKKNINYKSKENIMNLQDNLKFNDLMILNKSKAISKYGLPSKQEKFILDDLQGEFRIGLYNIYTKKERLSESILIDEITWEKNKDTWITVWYQIIENKTIPKDTLTWKKGTDF